MLTVAVIAGRFGEAFWCDPPAVGRIKDAIARTLAPWPVGSLGESAAPDDAPDRRRT